MAQSILYYPSISINDGTWLRNAILYWDEICSIVPYLEYDDFSPELLYLKSLNIYRAICPKDVFVLGYPDEFTEAANRYFRQCKKNDKVAKQRSLNSYIYDPYFKDLIHYNKLPSETFEMLRNLGIEADDHGWICMPSEISNGYMKILAEFVAKHDEKDTVIGTDKLSNLNQLYPKRHINTGDTALSIVFDKCFPVPSIDIGFEDLLDFKERRYPELLELREHIASLEEKISMCEGISDVKRALARFQEEWQKELMQFETICKDERKRFTLGSIRGFISGASSGYGVLKPAEAMGFIGNSPIITGATIAFSGLVGVGTAYMDYKKRINIARQKGGFAYIISAKERGLINPNEYVDIV